MKAIFYLFLALQLEVSQWRKHKADFLLVLLYFLNRMFNQCSQSNPSSGLDYMGAWTFHGCKCKTNVGDTEKFISLSQAITSISNSSKQSNSICHSKEITLLQGFTSYWTLTTPSFRSNNHLPLDTDW